MVKQRVNPEPPTGPPPPHHAYLLLTLCQTKKEDSSGLAMIFISTVETTLLAVKKVSTGSNPQSDTKKKRHISASRNDNSILKKIPGRSFKPIFFV